MVALCLIERALVRIEPQPGHAVQNGVHILLCGTLPIRIFDSQYELTALVPGIEPAEQCCADTPYVQNAGRAGREARAYFHEFNIALRVKARNLIRIVSYDDEE